MERIESIHLCEANGYDDINIRYQRINEQQWSWVLEQEFKASDFGFESAPVPAADRCSMAALISYCPFCGVDLTEAMNAQLRV